MAKRLTSKTVALTKPLGKPLLADDLEKHLPLGARVLKLGLMTGFREASVSALQTENFLVRIGSEKYVFSGVHEVLWDSSKADYADFGNSGGLIVTRDGLRPVGLHFCSADGKEGTRVSYIVPWGRIAAEFGLELL